MCQLKSTGIERCFAHSPASKFLKRMVSAKTGASDELISEAIHELNKEGKNVTAPSIAEVQQWIDKKRFATEIDPDLNTHERTIELNQLDRAKEAAKTGISGKAWHIWKNLKKRVIEKMSAFKKGAMAISLSGMLVFGVSGCAGTLDNDNNTPPPEPSDTPTSQPIEQELGDVIIATDKDGNPIIITDEYGSYAKTTISPDDDSMKLDKSKWEDTVATSGLTDDEVLSAQQWVATFIAEQGTDSIALDGTTGWEKWKTNEQHKYADPNLVDPNVVAPGSDRSVIISNNANNDLPIFIRDGQSRIAASDISVSNVWSKAYDGVANLFFTGSSTQQYRVTDDSMVEAIIRSNPGATKESVLAESPQYADGKDGTFGLTFTWKYGVEKTATGWIITGYNNSLNNAA